MPKSETILMLLCCGFAAITDTVQSANTVGLITNTSSAWPGYTLFPPGFSTNTHLINNAGNLIHSWTSAYEPGQSAYLAENGYLYRSAMLQNSVFNIGGTGGAVQKIDWDGTMLWNYAYSSTLHCQHHDFAIMPNGNVLLIAWEYKSQSEAVAAGRNLTLISAQGLWPDHVVEVQPNGATNGTIVWEWHLWDHLIQDYSSAKANYGNVTNNPQLVDINYNVRAQDTDWVHCNSIRYNSTFNQILISAHNLNEVWVIDHSTTTAQAAGHTGGNSGKGGDLLYRWGNPAAYRRGTATDKRLFGQHDAQWIATNCPGAGNILVFNNGPGRTGGTNYSTVDELAPPVDGSGNYTLASGAAYGPTSLVWTYKAPTPTNFFSEAISGAQRLPNGNTLICNGLSGIFVEVTSNGATVWQYVNPVGHSGPVTQGSTSGSNVFKIRRYATNYAGLVGRDLSELGTIELYTNLCTLTVASACGGQTPGTLTTNAHKLVSLRITNSPLTLGQTQYVANGASVAGNSLTTLSLTNVTLILTNNAVLTWLWTTNYWLHTAAEAHGSVNVGDGWQVSGVTTAITASAQQYFHFTNWTGDAAGGTNPLALLMDRPKAVTALFAENITANTSTPEWWLAQYGWTNNFQSAATNDLDGDGMPAWAEYIADTNPTNAASHLAIVDLSIVSNQVHITWTGGSNAWQYVECTPSLASQQWLPVFTNAPPTATTSTFTPTGAIIAPNQFYRVKAHR